MLNVDIETIDPLENMIYNRSNVSLDDLDTSELNFKEIIALKERRLNRINNPDNYIQDPEDEKPLFYNEPINPKQEYNEFLKIADNNYISEDAQQYIDKMKKDKDIIIDPKMDTFLKHSSSLSRPTLKGYGSKNIKAVPEEVNGIKQLPKLKSLLNHEYEYGLNQSELNKVSSFNDVLTLKNKNENFKEETQMAGISRGSVARTVSVKSQAEVQTPKTASTRAVFNENNFKSAPISAPDSNPYIVNSQNTTSQGIIHNPSSIQPKNINMNIQTPQMNILKRETPTLNKVGTTQATSNFEPTIIPIYNENLVLSQLSETRDRFANKAVTILEQDIKTLEATYNSLQNLAVSISETFNGKITNNDIINGINTIEAQLIAMKNRLDILKAELVQMVNELTDIIDIGSQEPIINYRNIGTTPGNSIINVDGTLNNRSGMINPTSSRVSNINSSLFGGSTLNPRQASNRSSINDSLFGGSSVVNNMQNPIDRSGLGMRTTVNPNNNLLNSRNRSTLNPRPQTVQTSNLGNLNMQPLPNQYNSSSVFNNQQSSGNELVDRINAKKNAVVYNR